MNLLDELFPDDLGRPFLTVDGEELTYGDVDERVRRMASVLAARGLRPGDRLVLQVPKSVDALVLTLACVRARIVFVPLNVAYTASEVEYFVTDSGASLVVDEAVLAELVSDAASLAPDPEPHADGDEFAPAAMLYTSGTTGRSKGAVLTHASLLANARGLRDVWAIEPDDVICHTLPIFHVHGLFVAIFPLMLEGARIRFHTRFDVGDVIADLPHCTVLMGVPTHYVRLLGEDRFDADLCGHVRLFTSGSAPMTEQVHAEFTARTGRSIVERYGMTETGILTSNPYASDDRGGQVPGTVGFPLPGHDVRVVDDAGGVVAPGASGGVEVALPVRFAGYWRQPDKTAEAITADGWFRTGDVGSLDADGRLSLDGRASDMIISGGYNVYPKEIELVLDDVAGVDETAVVGVPHHDFGEAVLAVVVLDGTVDEATTEAAMSAACDDALARFKHPKRYVFVDELPRNAMSKVQKNELRTRYHG